MAISRSTCNRKTFLGTSTYPAASKLIFCVSLDKKIGLVATEARGRAWYEKMRGRFVKFVEMFPHINILYVRIFEEGITCTDIKKNVQSKLTNTKRFN